MVPELASLEKKKEEEEEEEEVEENEDFRFFSKFVYSASVQLS